MLPSVSFRRYFPHMPTKALPSKADQNRTIARFKAKAISAAKKTAEYGEKIMNTGITLGAAAGMGWMAAKYPGKWMGAPKEVWVGGTFFILGLTGLGGDKMSDAMLAAGNGIAAAYLYNLVRQKSA